MIKISIISRISNKLIHELVRLRNRILKLQQEWKLNDNPFEMGLTHENIIKLIDFAKANEQLPEHNIYNTWEIPRRKRTSLNDIEDYLEDSLWLSDESEDEKEDSKSHN